MALKLGKMGYFKSRDSEGVTICYPNSQDQEFKILKTFKFDSERKCMSVVVKGTDGKILAFIKGADSSLLKMS